MGINTCLDSLRRLIAAGGPNGILLAENAVDEYWAATPVLARESGLSYVRQIVVSIRDAASGDKHSFADLANDYIEKKLADLSSRD
jgi:hypothetical protein